MPNPDTTAVTGDLLSLEAWYAAYGDLVHDHAGWRLRATAPGPSPNLTADVVHDTFMVASGAPRRPAATSPLACAWLLAIARNECLRVLRRHGPAPVSPQAAAVAPDVGPDPRHPAAGLPAAELRVLVGWAAEGLDHHDRELLELGVRHGLRGAAVGLVLGVPPDLATASLERLRREFGAALGALVLARSGASGCRTLQRLTERWDGTRTPRWRRRLLHHVDGCGRCSPQRAGRVDPVGILRLPPLVVAPPAVGRWVLADAADPTLAAERAGLVARAGPWEATGFPVPLDRAKASPRGAKQLQCREGVT